MRVCCMSVWYDFYMTIRIIQTHTLRLDDSIFERNDKKKHNDRLSHALHFGVCNRKSDAREWDVRTCVCGGWLIWINAQLSKINTSFQLFMKIITIKQYKFNFRNYSAIGFPSIWFFLSFPLMSFDITCLLNLKIVQRTFSCKWEFHRNWNFF